MAEVSRAHTDLGQELRRLAQSILDQVDPGVRAAAMMAISGGTGKCQQVWCPVCALAAAVTGEQHPLVTVIANHSVALLEVVRAIIDDIDDLDDTDHGDRIKDAGAATSPHHHPPGDDNGGA